MNIGRKFTVRMISALIVISIPAAYIYYRFHMANERERFYSLGSLAGPILEQGLYDYMMTRDRNVLDSTLANLSGAKSINGLWVVDRGGVIRASTDKSMVGTRLSPDDRVSLERTHVFRWVQPVANRQECHRCHSSSDKYNGAIVIDFSLKELEKHGRKDVEIGSLVFFPAMAIIGFVMFLMSKTIVIKRVNSLTGQMRKVKDGDYGLQVPLEGNDEITELQENFNEMTKMIALRTEELRESAERFKAIFENAHDGILVADTETKCFYMGNAKICSMLGYTQEELKNVGVMDIHPEEDIPGIIEKFEAVARRELALTRGLRVKRKDGGVLYVDIGASPVTFHGRKYAIGIFRDITKQKEMSEEREKLILELQGALANVSHSQKEWQNTFDSITDLISIHDRDFNVIKANRACAEYFGLSPQEILNRKCYELFHSMDTAVSRCPHRTTLHDGTPASAEVSDPRRGRIIRASTFPYYSPDGILIGSIHIARDVTQEREKEMRLIMSERLAGLGQMAAGIAHEINNPLATIAGCTEGLLIKVRNGLYDARLFEEYFGMILEEIQRCKSITTAMLSFVRNGTYEKRDIHLNEAVDKAIEIIGFQGRLGEVEIVREYSAPAPVVYGSEGELRQVFLSIITNALDAIDNRGRLTFRTGSGDGTAFVEIGDSGPGIPAEHLNRIFDPFFTTKSERGGTGLGLSIAHKIISNHGGAIQVFSEEGKGTAFRIKLPMC